jgi:hypothetical protein
MYAQNEKIISGIEERNFEYGNLHKIGNNLPHIFIKTENISFKDIFSRCEIYQSDKYKYIVKMFEVFGIIKKKIAMKLAEDFVTSCLSLRPIPRQCVATLELRSEIIHLNILKNFGEEDRDFIDCIKILSEISDSIFETYCEDYRSALEVHMAFYAEKIST